MLVLPKEEGFLLPGEHYADPPRVASPPRKWDIHAFPKFSRRRKYVAPMTRGVVSFSWFTFLDVHGNGKPLDPKEGEPEYSQEHVVRLPIHMTKEEVDHVLLRLKALLMDRIPDDRNMERALPKPMPKTAEALLPKEAVLLGTVCLIPDYGTVGMTLKYPEIWEGAANVRIQMHR